MGKLIFEFFIPGIALLCLAYWGVRCWWLRRMGKTIDNVIEIKKANKKYDNKLQ